LVFNFTNTSSVDWYLNISPSTLGCVDNSVCHLILNATDLVFKSTLSHLFLTIDDDAPVISQVLTKNSITNAVDLVKPNGSLKVWIKLLDSSSSINSVIVENTSLVYSSSYGYWYNYSVSINNTGNLSIYIEDKAGNNLSSSYSYILDDTPPSLLWFNSSDPDNVSNSLHYLNYSAKALDTNGII